MTVNVVYMFTLLLDSYVTTYGLDTIAKSKSLLL